MWSCGLPGNSIGSISNVSLFNLAPGGVYLATDVTTDAGGLLHHPFTLTYFRRRSTLCCTCLQVALSGRYPPPYPAESGLSSIFSYRGDPGDSSPPDYLYIPESLKRCEPDACLDSSTGRGWNQI